MSDVQKPWAGLLPHLGVLSFQGPDAAQFLQGQLSNDTRPLASHTPVLGSFSTPQGRVLAIIYLLPHASGIVGVLPRELTGGTAERLRKFVLRAKVKIEDVSEAFALAATNSKDWLDQQALSAPAAGAYAESGGVGVAHLARDASRYLLIAPPTQMHSFIEGNVEPQWRLADIRAGLPQVYDATRENFVAQMLNLDLVDGISFSKGCYTGQEIIARTQHLGRIKRRMFHLQLPRGEWQIGQAVKLNDGRAGKLTEVIAASATQVEALAVLNLDAGGGAEETGAEGHLVEARELTLPYALG